MNDPNQPPEAPPVNTETAAPMTATATETPPVVVNPAYAAAPAAAAAVAAAVAPTPAVPGPALPPRPAHFGGNSPTSGRDFPPVATMPGPAGHVVPQAAPPVAGTGAQASARGARVREGAVAEGDELREDAVEHARKFPQGR